MGRPIRFPVPIRFQPKIEGAGLGAGAAGLSRTEAAVPGCPRGRRIVMSARIVVTSDLIGPMIAFLQPPQG
jgi:hypothetical protein